MAVTILRHRKTGGSKKEFFFRTGTSSVVDGLKIPETNLKETTVVLSPRRFGPIRIKGTGTIETSVRPAGSPVGLCHQKTRVVLRGEGSRLIAPTRQFYGARKITAVVVRHEIGLQV